MLFEGKERKQREQEMQRAGRLPPGQALTLKWPVLHYGSVPSFNPATWDFRVGGLVENPISLSYAEFMALPTKVVKRDIHCVTRWSMFDSDWEGVPFLDIMERVKPRPEAKFVMALAENNFTANVPLADLAREDVLLAFKRNGE